MNMMVDLTNRFQWITNHSNKQWKRLFWRIRASLKKAFKSNGRRVRLLCIGARSSGDLRFQYDPSSYALNFDDGLGSSKDHQVDKQQEQNAYAATVNNDNNNEFRVVKIVRRQQVSPVVPEATNASANNTVTWVYVFWVKI